MPWIIHFKVYTRVPMKIFVHLGSSPTRVYRLIPRDGDLWHVIVVVTMVTVTYQVQVMIHYVHPSPQKIVFSAFAISAFWRKTTRGPLFLREGSVTFKIFNSLFFYWKPIFNSLLCCCQLVCNTWNIVSMFSTCND